MGCKQSAKVSALSCPVILAKRFLFGMLTVACTQNFGESITSLLTRGVPDGKISQCDIDKVKDWFARTEMLMQECIDPIDVVLEARKPKPLPLYMMM